MDPGHDGCSFPLFTDLNLKSKKAIVEKKIYSSASDSEGRENVINESESNFASLRK